MVKLHYLHSIYTEVLQTCEATYQTSNAPKLPDAEIPADYSSALALSYTQN